MAQQFDPDDRLKELKYENALYKILAAIGIIASKHQLLAQKTLKVYLGVLLPWNEYSDRQRFESQLDKMLAKFSFRASPLKVKLLRFLLRPEGAAYFLEPELEDYFNAEPNLKPGKTGGISDVRSGGYHQRDPGRHFSEICWGASSMSEMESALGLKGKDLAYQMMRHRLVDVFGLFDCMIESESSRESKKSA